ncbi:MAG TPA: HlyD family efflux transporter periplasmic adaptor subunit, partial [Bacteroidales bacterium]|nr:HlyD family efflux transporter periplasmic adaptor subunit [Bacteroidales bacterium]
ERNRILYSGKTIAEVDYENSKYAYSIEKESLSRIRLQQISDWQSDLTERREKQIILEAEHEKLLEELDSRVITAPLKGEIIQSVDIQSGSKVFYNQEIATISPDDSLVAVCLVSPKDIGLLHENQDVRIQVDAFNHSEWGLLKGKIKRIPEDITLDNNSDAWFVIECSPQQEYLSLKNGFKGYLRKGMTFNAMIFISRRSLFNLLFDKADKWLNPNLKPMSR